jgi:hypothetical protein
MSETDAVMNVAYAIPLNLPGEEPLFTVDTAWNALLHSIKFPQDYSPYILDSEISAETKYTHSTRSVTRVVYPDGNLYPRIRPDVPPPAVQPQEVFVYDHHKV